MATAGDFQSLQLFAQQQGNDFQALVLLEGALYTPHTKKT